MTDPIMDFFDDPNLFVGGLDGLAEEGFPPGPSLVDELNLSAGFEPLQVEPMGAGKHPGMIPTSMPSSTQQSMTYGQQMGHFPGMKAQNSMGQPFAASEGVGGEGMIAAQHTQFHGRSIGQAPQSNALFSNSSPMWGNQDQNGNLYHSVPQQQQQLHQQQQQQLHNQQHHLRQQQPQQQHHPCQQQLQQQQHQLLNQRQQQHLHQQVVNPQSLPQQHHSFPFHQANQQPAPHNQQLTTGGTQFHSRAVPNSGALAKANVETPNASLAGTPPQQGGYQLVQGTQGAFPGVGPEGSSMSFSMQTCSPMAHTLSSCSVSSTTAYPPSQYSFPGQGQPGTSSLSQPLSLAPVSMITTTTPLPSSVPELSLVGAGCAFSSAPGMTQHHQPKQVPVSQAEDECPFRALRCSRQTLGNYDSSEMFGQAMSCYPSAVSQLVPDQHQPQNCGSNLEVTRPPASTTTTNGYVSLEVSLAGLQGEVEAQGGGFEGLEAPDLLADELLPQLEAALSQHDHHDSNCSWINGGDGERNGKGEEEEEMKEEDRISISMDYKKQPPKNKNANGPNSHTAARVLSPPMKSSSSSSSSSSYSSSLEKRAQRRLVKEQREQQQQQLMEEAGEDKQQKANRIIHEAIAKARERGEKNIPRVMSPESFPSGSSSAHRRERERDRDRDRERDRGNKTRTKASKKARIVPSSKPKQKAKIGKIVIKFGGMKKKRKTESSEEGSDEERPPRRSFKDDDSTRRSNRQVKRKKYAEEGEARVSDEEVKVMVKAKRTSTAAARKEPAQQLFVENPSEEDAAVVDKIMSSRIVKNEVAPGVIIEVEEFFVKYKNYSYLHCEWAVEQQLEKDKRIQQKIKRFKIKQAQRAHFFADMEEDPFNPDYVEVDRVLEVSYCEDKDTGEVVYYLVKWCSLPYEDSTWELKGDVDQSKIEEFELLQAARPDSRRTERPPASLWKKRDQSREYRNSNVLRDYQLEGVNWLLFNWYNRRNCILADEMGLGKTIQSITFLEEIWRVGIRGPFLIIAPLSTIANWEREFRTWTHLNVIVYHGSMVSRQMLQQYEMYSRDTQGRVVRGAYKFHALITTFEMILGGCPELNAIEWRCVIIDEAHRLKNKNCKLLEGFKLMNLEHKVLLTGTPLQNTVEELFSLLHFLEPQSFPSENTFMLEFGDLKTEEQVQKLQAILKPMMLRRLKEDVEKKLAPKEETIIEVELTNIQKKYYRAILEKNFSFLSKGVGQANVPNLVNTMMELRKCCNHPYLIKGAEEKILEDFREVYSPVAFDFHLQAMVQSAGKLVLIDKLLPKMKAGGHKVLIFSQMVRCLDILEDYLIQRRYLYERIDGRVRGNLRQAAIDRFSKPDSDRFVFLLCTRAGGLGINLTAADTCIIFDSDWNPQNDLQAQARCHRIGQNKAVKVYRLITRNSYEREMFDRASLKLGLDKAVLQSMSGRENSVPGGGPTQQQLSKKEIEDLLRKGAYGALMDDEDEGAKFCEEDIDQILQRRTKTITIESEGRGSTFAKASFVASGNRTDISLDDPNFWDKWAKKAEIDMDTANGRNSLVIDTPRVRKQTRPFSATKDELAELSEGESDNEDKPKLRRPHDRLNSYGRTECFRVEKNLLVYGWGRWKDILLHGRFKKQLTERDVESICRALLAYCLVHYRGDDKIKSFMWDLIAPSEDGQTKELQNHLGLSTPVPRGRKGKKMKTQSSTFDIQKAEWIRKHNPEHMLQDEGYKKHLKHHCNKVLLRVRMLYYLKQEVMGSQSQKILDGVDSSEIKIWVPEPDSSELPALWWDNISDKCLLLGVYKHGYEKYNTVRADPAFCFLERVGRPDEKAIAAEQRANDFMDGDVDDPEYKPAPALLKDDMEDDASSPGDLVVTDNPGEGAPMMIEELGGGGGGGGDAAYWPSSSVLTARLRRLITASQRYTKSRQILHIHQTQTQHTTQVTPSLCPLPPTLNDTINPKMAAKIERQQRWTRREEADFYRVVSTFGVVFDPDLGCFDWTKFRAMARLHKKTDESLQKYLWAFTAMCRRVCRLPPREGDTAVDPSLSIQPITEERASRTLYRVELLRQVREQVLRHPSLYERLPLCQLGSDLPVWWETGTHDRDLLIGAAKHGVSRTDYHILRDPELCFMASQRNYSQNKGVQQPSQTPTPLLNPQYQASRDPALAESPVPTPAQMEREDIPGAVPKEEPLSEGEERMERGGQVEGERWSPQPAPLTPTGIEEKPDLGVVKGENESHLVAARTKPLTPNSAARKEKKANKRSRREARRAASAASDSDSDGSSSSSSSRSSSSSSSSSSSRSGSSSSSSSSCSSGSSSSSSSSSSVDSESEGEEGKIKVPTVAIVKGFDEDSVASLSTTQDEMQDSHVTENGSNNSHHHPFQGGYMLAASYWPKDRVMINRLDSICQAVLKGKWPGARRSYEAGGAVASFYTTKLLDNAAAANNSSNLCSASASASEDPSASPQGSKQEGGLKLTFQKQGPGQPLKRPLEPEEGPLSQQQYLTRLHELQSASDTSLADFTKPQAASFPQASTGLAGQMKLNGGMDGQPVVKRRRGRRKNVEGMDLLFMNRNRGPAVPESVPPAWGGMGQAGTGLSIASGQGNPLGGQGPMDTESRVSVINLKDGTRLAGDDAPRRRELELWLKEHPGFVADTGAFIPGVNKRQLEQFQQDGRPKQKRHRCRNPNKIDVNSLTGEERVQIINRRNARKVGGAFAPPLKDLCRFLQENPEYGVPPEWADVVKQSGYLPESMFDRILTGPIVPEEVSRRGRRPKSALAKAAATANQGAPSLGLNPLLANGLLSGMDLSSLQAFQQNLQSLQSLQLTAGLMGLPTDANNLAAMFPMMLSGMAGLPNLLSMGGLLGKPPQDTTGGAEQRKRRKGSRKGGGGEPSSASSKAPSSSHSHGLSHTSDTKGERTEGQSRDGDGRIPSVHSPSSSSATTSTTTPLSASAAQAASSHPLSLNPLLLSSMLYPGMLLTPGLNLPVSTTQPPHSDSKSDHKPTKTSKTAPSKPLSPRRTPECQEEESLGDKREESGEHKEENSGPEGSGKADSSSSSESGSSSSSSDGSSDSSDED